MAQEEPEKKEGESEEGEGQKKKKGYFQRIPSDMVLSPGGIILMGFALLLEISDLLIPMSGVDSLVIEFIPEIFFAIMLKAIAGVPISGQLIPLFIERVPLVSDIVPTFLFFFI